MNSCLERVALRSRARIVARHRRTNRQNIVGTLWDWAGPSRARLVVAVPAVVALVVAAGVWWLVSQLAGFGAILAGWSPPFTLAELDTAPPAPQPGPTRTGPSVAATDQLAGDDPAAWNFNNDPWAQLQREQLALQLRLQREARHAELTGLHSDPHPALAPPSTVPTYWRPAPAVVRARRPLPMIRALMITAVVVALAWGIGAFSLGVASSAGWIRQPPAFTQLDTPPGTTP